VIVQKILPVSKGEDHFPKGRDQGITSLLGKTALEAAQEVAFIPKKRLGTREKVLIQSKRKEANVTERAKRYERIVPPDTPPHL